LLPMDFDSLAGRQCLDSAQAEHSAVQARRSQLCLQVESVFVAWMKNYSLGRLRSGQELRPQAVRTTPARLLCALPTPLNKIQQVRSRFKTVGLAFARSLFSKNRHLC